MKTPTNQSCKFQEVTGEDILTLLNKLDNKSSSGKYDISNKILEYIKTYNNSTFSISNKPNVIYLVFFLMH